MRRSLPPVPLTLAFVNCINHGDLPGPVSLTSDDHRLQVFGETPVTDPDDNEGPGRAARGVTALSSWTIAEDTLPNRDRYGLDAQQK